MCTAQAQATVENKAVQRVVSGYRACYTAAMSSTVRSWVLFVGACVQTAWSQQAIGPPFSTFLGAGSPTNLAVSAQFVFVASWTSGVHILRRQFSDTTPPGNLPDPALIDTGFVLGPRADDLGLDGSSLYVLDAGAGDLRVYDLSPLFSDPPRAPELRPNEIDQQRLFTTFWSGLTSENGLGAWLVNGYLTNGGREGGLTAGEPCVNARGETTICEFRYVTPAGDGRRYLEVDRFGRFAAILTHFPGNLYGLTLLERQDRDDAPFVLSDELDIAGLGPVDDRYAMSPCNAAVEGDWENGEYFFTRGNTLMAVRVAESANVQTPHPPRPTLRPSPTPPFSWRNPYFLEPREVAQFSARAFHVDVEERLAAVLLVETAPSGETTDRRSLALVNVTAPSTSAVIAQQPFPPGNRTYRTVVLRNGFAYVAGTLTSLANGIELYDLRALVPPTHTPTPTRTATMTRTPTRTPTPRTPVPTSTATRTATPVTPRPADLDHDGQVGPADIRELLHQWARRRTGSG